MKKYCSKPRVGSGASKVPCSETIAGVGCSRSTTTGEIYHIKMVDGRLLPSAEFLRQELQRIEKT